MTAIELWDESLESLQADFDQDKIEFESDKDIDFKWCQLMPQEISMWISLCYSDDTDYDQVTVDDFNFIINRRGFTPRITNNLRNILVKLGIGYELVKHQKGKEK